MDEAQSPLTSSEEQHGHPMVTFVDEHGMLHSFPVLTGGELSLGAIIAALGQPGQALRLTRGEAAAVHLSPADLPDAEETPARSAVSSDDVVSLIAPGAAACPWCGQPITLARGTVEGAGDLGD